MKYNRSDILAKENRNSFRYLAFIRILSLSGFAKKDSPKEWDNLSELQEFEINVNIQGVEIDFLKLIDSLGNQLDEYEKNLEMKVEEKARELVLNRYRYTMDAIENVLNCTCKEEIEYIQKETLEGLKQ